MTTRSERIAAKLARLEDRLTRYVAAETAILAHAQSYTIGDRTLTRANLAAIQSTITKLETEIINCGGQIRVQRFVPRDT